MNMDFSWIQTICSYIINKPKGICWMDIHHTKIHLFKYNLQLELSKLKLTVYIYIYMKAGKQLGYTIKSRALFLQIEGNGKAKRWLYISLKHFCAGLNIIPIATSTWPETPLLHDYPHHKITQLSLGFKNGIYQKSSPTWQNHGFPQSPMPAMISGLLVDISYMIHYLVTCLDWPFFELLSWPTRFTWLP